MPLNEKISFDNCIEGGISYSNMNGKNILASQDF
jgi:hypothetical protein